MEEEPRSKLYNPYVSGTLMALLLLASVLLPRLVTPSTPGQHPGLCAPPGIGITAWLANSTVYVNVTNTGNTSIEILWVAAGNASIDKPASLEPGNSTVIVLGPIDALSHAVVRVRYRVAGCTYTSYTVAYERPRR